LTTTITYYNYYNTISWKGILIKDVVFWRKRKHIIAGHGLNRFDDFPAERIQIISTKLKFAHSFSEFLMFILNLMGKKQPINC